MVTGKVIVEGRVGARIGLKLGLVFGFKDGAGFLQWR